MDKKQPARPTHTGSARQEALRQAKTRGTTRPTHLITSRAAIALDPEVKPASTSMVRWARRAIDVGQGRQGVALRQEGDGPIEIGVRGRDGALSWRTVGKHLTAEQLRAWVREGFNHWGRAQ